MKKKIKDPNIKLIAFANQDVIATSTPYTGGNPDSAAAKGRSSFNGIDCGF